MSEAREGVGGDVAGVLYGWLGWRLLLAGGFFFVLKGKYLPRGWDHMDYYRGDTCLRDSLEVGRSPGAVGIA